MAETLEAPIKRQSEPYLVRNRLRDVGKTAEPIFAPRDRLYSSGDDTGSNQTNNPEAADSIQGEDEVKDYSTDTGSESENGTTTKPPKMTERRKAQDVAFSSWLVIYATRSPVTVYSNSNI